MRTNLERAERARKAYEAMGLGDEDVIPNLYDLVCDLLHFADLHAGEQGVTPNTETNGEYVARMGLWHYREEILEENECEGHPPGPLDPMGVTVYCDGSCRKGVAASQS